MVKFKNKILICFLFILCLFSFNCASINKPYFLEGSIQKININKKNDLVFCFNLENLSDKNITNCTLVLSLYDSDGEPAFNGVDYITFEFNEYIPKKEQKEFIANISAFVYEEDENLLFLDYCYIKNITYSDGSSWQDNFGLFSI